MLRFCKTCKKIQDERWMYSAEICELCHDSAAEAEERRPADNENQPLVPEHEAGAAPAGDGTCVPFLPGLEPAQSSGI